MKKHTCSLRYFEKCIKVSPYLRQWGTLWNLLWAHWPYYIRTWWLWWPGITARFPYFNTLRPRQNGRHFADDIFKCIFLNEIVSISIKISLKFVPKGPINNITALVQRMAWCRPGDKPLSEPMMVNLPTHICITRPQWVKHHLCIMQRFMLQKGT